MTGWIIVAELALIIIVLIVGFALVLARITDRIDALQIDFAKYLAAIQAAVARDRRPN